MDIDIFVQNVKFFCKQREEPPTVACKNAGVGHSFLTDVKRGRIPNITKVQQLAEYLNVTTSELLGEEKPAGGETSGLSEEAIELINLFDRGSPELRAELLGYARGLATARKSQGTAKGGQ